MIVHAAGIGLCSFIKAHAHEEAQTTEFHYFVNGDGVFSNCGLGHTVKPGSLFISAPQDRHEFHSESGKRCLLYWIQFRRDSLQPELQDMLTEKFSASPMLVAGTGWSLSFEEIRRRSAATDAVTKISADYRFLAFLCDLLAPYSSERSEGTSDYIDEALTLMQSSLGKDLDLDSFASRLGIDKSYFIRVFKRAIGMSPMRYYLGLRLEAARTRLRDSDEPLREIALELGFRDEFHLSHQFKQHAGVSPKAWRSMTRSHPERPTVSFTQIS